MNNRAVYADVLGEVLGELGAGLERAVAGGVAPERIVLDPGLGFAKNADHDLTLLAHFARLRTLGRPLLVAASRKRFLGRVLAADAARPATAGPRARRRDRRRHRDRRPRGRLGGAGARGARERRRGTGGPRHRGRR